MRNKGAVDNYSFHLPNEVDKPHVLSPKVVSNIKIMYLFFLLIWVLVNCLLYIFLKQICSLSSLISTSLGLVFLLINLVLWIRGESMDMSFTYRMELEKMQYLERNAAHMLTAFSCIVFLFSLSYKNDAGIINEHAFYSSIHFFLLSISIALVGVLPKIWIAKSNPLGLVLLRHLKTIFFTYSIFFMLNGIINVIIRL